MRLANAASGVMNGGMLKRWLLTILMAGALSACGYVNQTDLIRREKAETERRVRNAIVVGASVENVRALLERSNYHCSLLPPLEAYPPYYEATPAGVEWYGCVGHLRTLTSHLEYAVDFDAKNGKVQAVRFNAQEFGGGLGMVM